MLVMLFVSLLSGFVAGVVASAFVELSVIKKIR